ncbi:MAG: polysaccharide biosynthesis tyrosine autokinase [Streptosporangiaceae bacterium]
MARRRAWWIGGLCLLGLAGSIAGSLAQRATYTATAQVLVQVPVGFAGITILREPVTPVDVQTEAQLATGAPVRTAIRRQLGRVPPATAAEVGQTSIIAISASSPSRRQAAIIANAYAAAYVRYSQDAATIRLVRAEAALRAEISSIQRPVNIRGNRAAQPVSPVVVGQEAVLREQLAELETSGVVYASPAELAAAATAPARPASPNLPRNALLGLVTGLLIGLGAAFVRDSLEDSLVTRDAVARTAGYPVLAVVPRIAAWRDRGRPFVAAAGDPASPATEAYRGLRTALQFARQERDLRAVVITSPVAGEGKTTTLANLAVLFAQAGTRVVVVSGDLRRPRIGAFLGVDEQAGLSYVLAGRTPVLAAVRPVRGQAGLWLLPAGALPDRPAELLASADVGRIVAELRATFDLVLIDTPPVLPVTDAVLLAGLADAVLMVATGRTRRHDLRRAADELRRSGASVLGVVLNDVTRFRDDTSASRPYCGTSPPGETAHRLGRTGRLAAEMPGKSR